MHAAYWKYTVLRRITGEPRGSFELKGSNWFARPDSDADECLWSDDRALLERTHVNLRSAVERLTNRDLGSVFPKSKVNLFDLIAGIAAHDLYHAGQIQLIKRLTTSNRNAHTCWAARVAETDRLGSAGHRHSIGCEHLQI